MFSFANLLPFVLGGIVGALGAVITDVQAYKAWVEKDPTAKFDFKLAAKRAGLGFIAGLGVGGGLSSVVA